MVTRRKAHKVILSNDEGKVEVHPLKTWFRAHREYWTNGIGPEGTSHRMRGILQKHGWVLWERMGDVLVIRPLPNGDTSYAGHLTGESELEDVIEDNEDEYEPLTLATFGLERDLQQALRGNIAQLEPDLTITDGGHEYVTEAGRIDILATDSKQYTVVIELKAGTAQPGALEQLLAYMATFVEGSKGCSGILIAGDFHPRVLQAAKLLPSIRLIKYSFQFRFEPVSNP